MMYSPVCTRSVESWMDRKWVCPLIAMYDTELDNNIVDVKTGVLFFCIHFVSCEDHNQQCLLHFCGVPVFWLFVCLFE